jgi:RHS repeat-associated protein
VLIRLLVLALALVLVAGSVGWSPFDRPAAAQPLPAGPTWLSAGDITSDQTWGPDGSPYVVTGRIRVQAGVTLTVLPGTVVKFVPMSEVTGSSVNSGQLVVSGGRLVARGTGAEPIVFTSSHDDSAGGDSDGAGRAPARGDWLNLAFTAGSDAEALEMPVSVVENTSVRYAGEAATTGCTGGTSVSVAERGRLHLSRSEVVESKAAGINISGTPPGLGVAAVSHTRFADNGCAMYAMGGGVWNNVMEASNGRGLYAGNANGVRVLGNWIYAESTFGGAAPTREQADVRGNALLGGVANQPAGQDHTDLRFNYWGPTPTPLGQCLLKTTNHIPAVEYDTTQVCATGYGFGGAYFTSVLPFAGAPPVPEVGPGATVLPPGGVPTDQTFGGQEGSEYGMRGAGTQADPVSSATGSFLAEEVDARLPAAGLPVVASRTYNSLDESTGWLGKGWSTGFEASLVESGDGLVVTLRAEDGQRLRFDKQADGSYAGRPGVTASLSRDGQGWWTLTTRAQLRRVFGPDGRLRSTFDRNDNEVAYGYDTQGRLTSITNDTRAFTLGYGGGAGTRIRSVTLPGGRSVGYDYTGDLLTGVTDLAGRTTTYGYDAAGRLNKVTAPDGTVTMRLTYGGTGRVTDQWDALDKHTTFAWDPATQTATLTDPRGAQWVDRYQDNLLIERTTPHTPAAARTTYTYDANLQLIAVDAPRGARSLFGYSAAGDLVNHTGPSGTLTTAYDTHHNPVSSVNARGVEVTYRYDTDENLTDVERPNPADAASPLTTSYTYDSRGLPATTTDARNQTTTYTYDPDGDLTAVQSPSGSRSTFTHDADGRLTASVDPRGSVPGADPADWDTTFTWTDDDQPATQTDPLGHGTGWTYDTRGRLQAVTDAKNRVTTYGYDAASHLTSLQGPDPAIPATTYGYDANGNTTSMTDTMGRTTTYTFDAANRPITAATPLGTYSYAYDAASNIRQVTDPANKITKTTHDANNRLVTIDYPTGTTDVSFTYDANGNRKSMTDAAGTATYAYDALDRLTTVTRGTQIIRYGYDRGGGIASVTYPDGTLYTYAYDADHRLDTVTNGPVPGAQLADYDYDPAGQVTQISRPNATLAAFEYDHAGRLTSILDRRSGGPDLVNETYTYDPAGNLTGIADATGPGNSAYTYDTLDRLTKACFNTNTCTGATDTVAWTYDNAGNRTTETRPAGTTTYTYAATSGLLTGTSGPVGTSTYTYDALGQLKTTSGAAGTATLTYSAAGRLTTELRGSSTTAYTYDGDGRRLSATKDGTRTNFTWLPIGYQLATETDASGALIRRYSYGLGRIGFQPADGTQHAFHTDHQGSIRATTNAAGDRERSYTWEPYGLSRTATQHLSGSPASPTGWAGEYQDPSGSIHLRARQYDPTTGRFTTPDPAGSVGPSASFTYGDANPLAHTDPYGLWSLKGTVGAIVDAAPLIATVSGGLAMIPTPLSPVFGGVALAAGAVTAIDSAYNAYSTCAGQHKGSCAGAIVTAAIDTTTALPGAALGGRAVRTYLPTRRAAKNVDNVVLGHYPEYVDLAKATGGRTFQVPTSVWDKMSPAEQWTANQKFLDRAIAHGSNIQLATPANAAREGSFFERELQYMQSRGYTVGPDGMSLIAPGGP